MTRETKLGLIVAGSFLALVGGVMGVKSFFHPSKPSALPEVKEVAEASPPPIPTPETKPAPVVEKPPTAIVPHGDEVRFSTTPPNVREQFRPAPAPNGNDLILSAPLPPLDAPTNRKPEPTPAFQSATSRDNSDLMIIPVVGQTDKPLPIDLPALPTDKDAPKKTEKPPALSLDADPLAPSPKEKTATPLTPKTLPKGDAFVKAPEISIPMKPIAASPEDLEAIPPAPKSPAPKSPVPEVKSIQLSPAKPAPAVPILDPSLDLPPPPDAIPAKQLPPLQNAPKVTEQPVPAVVPKVTEQPVAVKPPEPARIEIMPSKPKDIPPQDIQPSEAPMREPTPAVAAKPADDNYEEDLYTLHNGETFPAISKLHYRSETYTVALQKYNRDNPSGKADFIRIPPVWVLEKRYPNDVSTSVQPANFAAPPAAEPTRPTEKFYTVDGNGEFLAEIAQKTLGNEDAWTRIKELNKNINEVKRIPGGTRLILPLEAKVP